MILLYSPEFNSQIHGKKTKQKNVNIILGFVSLANIPMTSGLRIVTGSETNSIDINKGLLPTTCK